jgi:translation initiation factor 2B subunit (eIF-2B alpha/beta/delta family)
VRRTGSTSSLCAEAVEREGRVLVCTETLKANEDYKEEMVFFKTLKCRKRAPNRKKGVIRGKVCSLVKICCV